jgi:anti-anti-sigma factor
MSAMTIGKQEHGKVTVIRIEGELRETGEEQFIQCVTECFDTPACNVVLDLSGLNYVTSAGLGAIVRVTAQANQQGARVVLAAISPFMAGLMETTRLDKYFEIHPTVDAAVAALR